jgi:thiamine biosynthesis lipoprotein
MSLVTERTTQRMATLTLPFQAMASSCEIHLEGVGTPGQLRRAAVAAVEEVRRIEIKYSRYRVDSIVSRINAQAGTGQAVAVDSETAGLIDFAAALHAFSEGLFDITSGVLRQAWDFKAGQPPTDVALQALLPLIGWQQVAWADGQVSLPQPGMELDFGGFGKEYAADRAAGVLMAAGVQHGWVNLGGDIRVLGPRADGRPWRFGIQHPRQAKATIASVELSGGALATSGDYERFMVHQGRRYCHILNPRTGWPVHTWQSISATAPACTAAGALTTIAMLKGEAGPDFMAAQQAGYLAVDAQGALVHQGI